MAPFSLRLNHWALSGDWIIRHQSIFTTLPHANITYRFHARDLNLIMGPPNVARVHFRVFIDGKPVRAAAGIDIDGKSYGTVIERRMYLLIRLNPPIIDHEITIEFLDAGAELFSMTFG